MQGTIRNIFEPQNLLLPLRRKRYQSRAIIRSSVKTDGHGRAGCKIRGVAARGQKPHYSSGNREGEKGAKRAISSTGINTSICTNPESNDTHAEWF